jgi:hypothetical protein
MSLFNKSRYIYSSVQAKKKTNEPDMPPSLAQHQKYAA